MNHASARAHFALATAVAALLSPPAFAQGALPDGVEGEQEIVVTGARAENLGVIAAKRDTDGIADFLSEDEAGKLPDLNIAESLRRIPGVTSIFDEDRGRFVTVRGLSANLNYVTIDGLGVATTDEFGGTGRKVNLEVIPSSAVGLLEVRKTFTPDIDGGAIGGYVDLHTRSAFAGKPRSRLTVEGGLNYQTYKDVPDANNGEGPLDSPIGAQFDIGYATRFGAADQFGVMIAAHFKQDQRDESKNIQASEAYYNAAGAAVNPLLADGSVNPAWNGFVAPAEVRSYDYTNRVRDYGANAKLEYREGPLHLSLLGYYYAENQQETRNAIQYLTLDQARNQTADSGTLRLGQVRIGWNFNPLDRQNAGTIFSSRYQLGDRSALSLKAGWSYNDFDDFQPLIEFRGTPANRALTYQVAERDPAKNVFTFADTAGLLNPTGYTLNTYNEQTRFSKENVYDAKLDYGFNVDKGAVGLGFRIGGEYRRLHRERDNSRTDYGSNNVRLTSYALQTDFQPYWLNFPLLWVDGRKFIREVVPSLTVNAASTAERAIIEDYQYIEDSLAGYALVTYAGDRFKLVAGARYENVSTTAITPGEVLAAGFLTRKGGYDRFLPSATLAYDLTRDLRLKLGASQSLGRPNPGDIAQRERRNETTDTISRGNPDLKPRVATNLDLGLEYYLPGRNGLVSAAVFYKDIKDEIFTQAANETIDGTLYRVTTPRNAEGAKVKGIELGLIVNRFDFLPRPLDGFGFTGNVTYVDGEVAYIDTNGNFAVSDRLVDQSRWFGNASLFYEIDDRVELRMSYNYWGEYIDSIVARPWEAQGWGAFETLDAAIRYDISDQWKLKLKARNLLNSNRQRIRGIGLSDLYEEVEFGQSFFLNLSFNY